MSDAKKNQYAIEFIKGDWDKAQYLDDPQVDNLQGALIRLGTELWAVRRRQMVVESLLEQKGLLTNAAIESYRPTAKQAAEWDAERDDLIERVFAILYRIPEQTGENPPMAKVPPLGRQA